MTHESVLIGCCILEPELMDKALTAGLSADHFTDHKRRDLWKALVRLRASGRGLDMVTLSMEPGGAGLFDAFMEAEKAAPTVLNYETARDGVLWDYRHRQILKKATAVLSADSQESVLAAVSGLTEAASATHETGHADITVAAQTVENEFQEVLDGKPDSRTKYAMPCKAFSIDLGDIHDNELIVLAARPSIGKTSFALGMVTENVRLGMNVAIVPTEMEAKDVIRQLTSQVAQVNLQKLKEEFPEKIRKAQDSARRIRECKQLRIFDRSTDLSAIEASVRSVKGWADIIIIDQLAQIRNGGRGRYESVTDTCYAMVALKKYMGKPLVLAHQLSRPEKGTNPAPTLSDLKDSGAVEEVASRVIFIHYPTEGFGGQTQVGLDIDPPDTRDYYLIQAKHRFGVKDISIKCQYRSTTTTFLPYIK